VIHDVLDISRIESGQLHLEPSDFVLRELVDDVQEIVCESARAKGLRLGCAIAPDVPGFLRGDAGRVRQVLLNLVGNAVKFTQRGSVEIEVSLEGGSGDEERSVRFQVRDTGIGIPADRTRRIFDRFTQADVSTTRRFGGSGLGLSIAKQLTHRMRGKIGVESQDQAGSTFWFTLPLARGGVSDGLVEITESERSIQSSSPPDPARTVPGRILLAEDNPVNQEVAVAMLELLGHRVEVASDGHEALEALERTSFDLVLMDCQMPGPDGFEATARLRENEAGADAAEASGSRRVPVVAITASAMQGDRERCLAAGMDDYLSKPFTLPQLGSVLAKWLPEAPASTEDGQAE